MLLLLRIKGTGQHAGLSASFTVSALSLALGDQKSFGAEAGAEGRTQIHLEDSSAFCVDKEQGLTR